MVDSNDREAQGGPSTQVESVEAHVLKVVADPPWNISTSTMSEMFATVVQVRLADGSTGWGECIGRLAPSATKVIIDELLGPLVVGRDARQVEDIWDQMWATMRYRGHSRGYLLEAMAGVDIALWDALGRALGEPIHGLLRGAARTEVPCYASSILLKDPKEAAEDAVDLVESGYRAIKLKVGRDVGLDTRAVREVRAAIGDEIELMLDANGFYAVHEAVALTKYIWPYDVAWLEEPLPTDDVEGYRRLVERGSPVPLASGEAEFTVHGFLPFLQDRLLAVVQPDVARAGGITGARRIATVAQAYDTAFAPHVGASGALCIAASLQLSASVATHRTFEDMFLDQPLQHLTVEPLPRPDGGTIAIPRGPGLGVEVDEAKVRAYRQGS
jgi:L-alanine-DL-glutamate epimerase-like enolase superfamily enzyme